MNATATSAPTNTATSAVPDRFNQLGKLSWLWMNSPLHHSWSMDLAAKFLLPAIEHQQIHIEERDGMPVAFCSWAWLSADAEMRYLLDATDVRLEDWQSGDRLWFMDWLAPFGGRDSWNLVRAMKARFPDQVGRSLHVKVGETTAHVAEFRGRNVSVAQAQEKLRAYHTEFFHVMQALQTSTIQQRRVRFQ